MTYRREIDGLRGVAVLAVIFYHAGIKSSFPGGYIGVDVFFVISGYLITSIILKERKSGTFTFSDFYERRARRILPALFFVMLCCIPFAYYLMSSEQLTLFSNSLIAVSLFVSNVLFFLEDDYFGLASELKPLLHTWSLAIEEQFYVLFPAFLIAFIKLRKRKLIFLIFAIASVSILLAQLGGNLSTRAPFIEPFWLWTNIGGWAFFLTPTRAWELLLGVLAALYLIDKSQPKGNISQIGSCIGLILILYASLFFRTGTPMPGFIGLIPTVGTVLLIVFASPYNIVGKLLGLSSFVGIGLISYSAYLWHVPLFAFSRLINDNEPTTWVSVLLIIFSLIAGYFSYKFIEKPFRNRANFTRKQIFTFAVAFSAFFVILGFIGNKTEGFFNIKYSWVDDNKKYLVINEDKLLEEREKFWTRELRDNLSSKFDENSKTRILIIGDSHAEDLAAAFILNRNILEKKYQVRYLPFDETCMKKLNDTSNMRKLCRQWVHDIDTSGLIDSASLILASSRWTEESIEYLPNLKKWTGNNANKLVIVGRTAEYTKMVKQIAMEILKNNTVLHDNEVVDKTLALHFDGNVEVINNQIKVILDELDIPYLDRVRLICTDQVSEAYEIELNKKRKEVGPDVTLFGHMLDWIKIRTAANPLGAEDKCDFFSKEFKSYYFDYGHWTREGAIFFSNKLSHSEWIPILDSKLSDELY
jgi:peptidoglycan/LPS O-acetylase OafA/YrhL